MNDLTPALFGSIVPIFIFVMMGYALRRMGVIGGAGTDRLGKWVLLFLFPILVFQRLAETEDPRTLLTDWPIFIWAFVVLVGSGVIGWCWHRGNRLSSDTRTFVFLVGMPNWIYLPLALAGPIWGEEAVRLIILFNIPTQFILWTIGIWVLKGDLKGVHALRSMLTSPGLMATVAGLLVAFGIIPVTLIPGRDGLDISRMAPALRFVGGFTIPLSLVGLGLYVGERSEASGALFRQAMWVSAGRLIVAPLCIMAIIFGLRLAGLEISPINRWVLYLIATMPVAVSVPLFAAMYNRDRFLASRSVVFSTMAGFITSPILIICAIKIEAWLGW